MKPSLPTFLFDLALVPEHDRLWFQRNVESTLGMLSPSQTSAVDPARGVVLLGGVSKHFHWSDALVAEQVVRIVSQTQDISWQIIDSRRTPESYRRQLKLPTNAKYVHWRDTQPSWLTHQLSRSSATWVTPDMPRWSTRHCLFRVGWESLTYGPSVAATNWRQAFAVCMTRLCGFSSRSHCRARV